MLMFLSAENKFCNRNKKIIHILLICLIIFFTKMIYENDKMS